MTMVQLLLYPFDNFSSLIFFLPNETDMQCMLLFALWPNGLLHTWKTREQCHTREQARILFCDREFLEKLLSVSERDKQKNMRNQGSESASKWEDSVNLILTCVPALDNSHTFVFTLSLFSGIFISNQSKFKQFLFANHHFIPEKLNLVRFRIWNFWLSILYHFQLIFSIFKLKTESMPKSVSVFSWKVDRKTIILDGLQNLTIFIWRQKNYS